MQKLPFHRAKFSERTQSIGVTKVQQSPLDSLSLLVAHLYTTYFLAGTHTTSHSSAVSPALSLTTEIKLSVEH